MVRTGIACCGVSKILATMKCDAGMIGVVHGLEKQPDCH